MLLTPPRQTVEQVDEDIATLDTTIIFSGFYYYAHKKNKIRYTYVCVPRPDATMQGMHTYMHVQVIKGKGKGPCMHMRQGGGPGWAMHASYDQVMRPKASNNALC